MRIQHVVTTLDVGGAEMHLLAQTRGQTARGHRVRVAYLKGLGTLRQDFLAAGAEQVRRLGQGPLALPRAMGLFGWPDVVHSHLLKADALCALAAALGLRWGKLVASKHNDEQALRRPLVSLCHGLLSRAPRKTIVLSDHVGRFVAEFGRVPRARLVRIYYGLDPGPFDAARATGDAERAATRAELGLEQGEVVFVCVARFAPQKAHELLLRAFARVRERCPQARARLLLVGDDPYGDGRIRAEERARALGLGDAVVFAGIRRDVPRLLAASDVFVMASLWEGLGLVFLEAMASYLPVVATRVSAIPEVVEEGVTGCLAPPGDAGGLAEAMERLALDASLRQRLARAGRARLEQRFGLERMIEETLAVYAGLGRSGLQPPPAPGR